MSNKKEYENIAAFEIDNCSYIINQPKEEKPEDIEDFYIAMGKIIFDKNP